MRRIVVYVVICANAHPHFVGDDAFAFAHATAARQKAAALDARNFSCGSHDVARCEAVATPAVPPHE